MVNGMIGKGHCTRNELSLLGKQQRKEFSLGQWSKYQYRSSWLCKWMGHIAYWKWLSSFPWSYQCRTHLELTNRKHLIRKRYQWWLPSWREVWSGLRFLPWCVLVSKSKWYLHQWQLPRPYLRHAWSVLSNFRISPSLILRYGLRSHFARLEVFLRGAWFRNEGFCDRW